MVRPLLCLQNKRINGKVVQTVKANLGPVTEEQIPYLKAAYAAKKADYPPLKRHEDFFVFSRCEGIQVFLLPHEIV